MVILCCDYLMKDASFYLVVGWGLWSFSKQLLLITDFGSSHVSWNENFSTIYCGPKVCHLSIIYGYLCNSAGGSSSHKSVIWAYFKVAKVYMNRCVIIAYFIFESSLNLFIEFHLGCLGVILVPFVKCTVLNSLWDLEK